MKETRIGSIPFSSRVVISAHYILIQECSEGKYTVGPWDIITRVTSIHDISRTCSFYALGSSLGSLLEINSSPDYVKALNQLLNEFDYYNSDHSSKQKMVNRAAI